MKSDHFQNKSVQIRAKNSVLKSRGKIALCASLILLVMCSSFSVFQVLAPDQYFMLKPYALTVGGPDDMFVISITLLAYDVYGWDIKLYYESSIVNVASVAEGQFLKSGGETLFIRTIDNEYNETHGRITVACALLGDVSGVSGSGVIATVTFRTKEFGFSYLELEDTKLANPNGQPIPHAAYDGYVTVVPVERDVAVKNVTTTMTEAIAGQLVNINVTVANEGNKTETFDISVYRNETIVSTQTVTSLAKGANKTVTFTWNTSGTNPGESYVIKAEVPALSGETDLDDNVLVDGAVRILAAIHDVAVRSITVSASEVYASQTVDIFVSVRNSGNFTETFNVTAYYGDVFIAYQTVNSLLAGANRDLLFVWNTTGFPVDVSYQVKAVASAVTEEVNLADNTFVDGAVTILAMPVKSITILEVVPCNQVGDPASTFKVGGMAYFKVKINAVNIEKEEVLVTVNVFDADQTTIGLVCIKGPIVNGISFFILALPMPQVVHVGTASVYANVFSNWPHLGGVPYCPEVSASFTINRG